MNELQDIDTLVIAIGAVTLAWFVTIRRRRKPTSAAKRMIPQITAPVLAQFNLADPRKLCENVMLIGATGSGKTSVIKRLMTEFLRQPIGCCFLTVKPDSPLDYAAICRKAGRRDVQFFEAGVSRCNLLAYELNREGGSPESAAELIQQMDDQQSRTSGSKEDSFWKTTRKEATIHAIDLCHVAFGDKITLQDVYSLLADVPAVREHATWENPLWEDNKCRRIIEAAASVAKTPEALRRVQAGYDLFVKKIPSAGGKVAGATTLHVAGLIAPFTRGRLYDTVCTTENDITPDWVLNGGIIIFADAALEGQGYQFFQLAFSQILTRAALARRVTPQTPTVIICLDEYHMISAPQADAEACTQGRSQKLARITAVQSVSTLLNAMNEGLKAKHQAWTLIGNHNTKVFLSNTDPETGQLFEQLSGKHMRIMTGGSTIQHQQQQESQFDPLGAGAGFGMNFHQQVLPRKFSSALTWLKTGGAANNFEITGYVHQAGTVFENGLPFKRFSITQDLEP